MRKLMIALAAAAIAMTSIGATSIRALALLCNYEKDTSPSDAHEGWYSMYVMTTDSARALMGTSTFSYEGFNTWLGNGFGANSSSIKGNADSVTCWGYNGSRYVFSNNMYGEFDDYTDVLGVWFFDNGTDLAYYVAGMNDTCFYFSIADQFADYKSGWQAVSVPEPTSGLLLLLGMAGLALRRRRA